jgi:hypothetical protein
MALIASQGAVTDGTAVLSFPAFATRTFSVVQKPIQASVEFRQKKALIPGKAVSPPVYPKAVQILFHRDQGLQKFWVTQPAFLA